MGMIISNSALEYLKSNAVPVIASFSAEGGIKPIYVKLNDISFKIESFYIKERHSNQIAFVCQIIDEDYLKSISMTYHSDLHLWALNKS